MIFKTCTHSHRFHIYPQEIYSKLSNSLGSRNWAKVCVCGGRGIIECPNIMKLKCIWSLKIIRPIFLDFGQICSHDNNGRLLDLFQTNLPVFRVKESSVRRRYSDFEWLRNELERDSKVTTVLGGTCRCILTYSKLNCPT